MLKMSGQIISTFLGPEMYAVAIKENVGTKAMISTACGYALKWTSARESWSGLVER
jgi:hypothetical protein